MAGHAKATPPEQLTAGQDLSAELHQSIEALKSKYPGRASDNIGICKRSAEAGNGATHALNRGAGIPPGPSMEGILRGIFRIIVAVAIVGMIASAILATIAALAVPQRPGGSYSLTPFWTGKHRAPAGPSRTLKKRKRKSLRKTDRDFRARGAPVDWEANHAGSQRLEKIVDSRRRGCMEE